MHRVITKFRDRHGKIITEHGPWHMSRDAATEWAETLRSLGYQAEVESQGGHYDNGSHTDLAKALASMA